MGDWKTSGGPHLSTILYYCYYIKWKKLYCFVTIRKITFHIDNKTDNKTKQWYCFVTIWKITFHIDNITDNKTKQWYCFVTIWKITFEHNHNIFWTLRIIMNIIRIRIRNMNNIDLKYKFYQVWIFPNDLHWQEECTLLVIFYFLLVITAVMAYAAS